MLDLPFAHCGDFSKPSSASYNLKKMISILKRSKRPKRTKGESIQCRGNEGKGLYMLAHDKKWGALIKRAKRFPSEASWKNEYGETALHIVLWGSPPRGVVDALLEVMPYAASVRDTVGRTPLHTACWNLASSDILRRLLEVNPEAARAKDDWGTTPITLWWCRWMQMESNRNFVDTRMKLETNHLFADRTEIHDSLLDMTSLLRAAYDGTIFDRTFRGKKDGEKFHMLHAACKGEDYPSKLMKMALQWNPEGAAVRDHNGRFPLLAVIEKGMPWLGGVEDFVRAAPNALYARDPESYLLPFMVAATCKRASLDTTYSLLQAAPELVIQERE